MFAAKDGDFTMLNSTEIYGMSHVHHILDEIRNFVQTCKRQIGDITEADEEKINFQLCEIDDYIIGVQTPTKENTASSIIRLMLYWEYIDNDKDFDELITELRLYEGEV